MQSLLLLRCFELPDCEFVRIGPCHDAGYVLHKDLCDIQVVISIGIADDTSFEEDLALHQKDITFFLFDHTTKPKRKLPRNFHFFSLGLGASTVGNLVSLEEITREHLRYSEKAILKMDIEGSEYLALQSVSADLFARFEQIIIEIHNLDGERILSDSYINLLKNLRASFHLVHIHANNNDGFVLVAGVPIPRTLELTFLNKSKGVQEVPGSARFPRSCDYPNASGDDLVIGAFQFPIPNHLH